MRYILKYGASKEYPNY